MPRRYPVEFRRKVLDLIEAGRPIAEVAVQLGVSDQTIYNWRAQDQIDRGVRVGVSTSESAELAAARKRIRDLETELAVTKRAHELLQAQSDPKGGGRSSRRSRARTSPSKSLAAWSACRCRASTCGANAPHRRARCATP